MPNKRRKQSSPNNSTDDLEVDEDKASLSDLCKMLKNQDKKLDKKLDKLSEICEDHRDDLQQLHDLVADNMKELNAVKADTTKLKTNVAAINSDLLELRQEVLANNIVVSGTGLKIDKDKSPMENFLSLTSVLKFEISATDVSDIFLVNRKSGPALIVKLIRSTTKMLLMDALRKLAKIAGTEGVPGEIKTIYISDQLTSFYEYIWFKTRQLKKKAKLTSATTVFGKIYVRESETGGKIRIRTQEDLIDLYKKHGLEI